MTPNGIITLLTDFSTIDGYVGAMKGVILAECESARIVDLTHEVPPGDVAAGAHALEAAAVWFPKGTIHVGVVDPGVGSARRAIAVRAFGQIFLGPDNGLLSAAIAVALPRFEAAVRHVDRTPPEWRVAATFHGRDLFARVAGRLAAGDPLDEYSSGIAENPVLIANPMATLAVGGVVSGEIVHVDHYGNLISNLGVELLRRALRTPGEDPEAAEPGGATLSDADLAGRFSVEIGGKTLPLVATFADVASGAPLAYVGSSRRIAIAVRDGSAAKAMALGRGTRVSARPR